MFHAGIKRFIQNIPSRLRDDGGRTGVVHTAVMYGEDDYNLGKRSACLSIIPWTSKGSSRKM